MLSILILTYMQNFIWILLVHNLFLAANVCKYTVRYAVRLPIINIFPIVRIILILRLLLPIKSVAYIQMLIIFGIIHWVYLKAHDIQWDDARPSLLLRLTRLCVCVQNLTNFCPYALISTPNVP